MKLKHWIGIALLLIGGYVVVHWLFGHGGMASFTGTTGVGSQKVSGMAGFNLGA